MWLLKSNLSTAVWVRLPGPCALYTCMSLFSDLQKLSALDFVAVRSSCCELDSVHSHLAPPEGARAPVSDKENVDYIEKRN